MQFKDVIKRLLAYARYEKAGYIASILCFFAAASLEPIIPATLGKVLNEGFLKESPFPLWIFPVILVAVFIGRGIFSFGAQYSMSAATSKTVLRIRLDLMHALIYAKADLFHELSPGAAVNKVVAEPQAAVSLVGGAITTVLRDGTYTIVMVLYLLYLNWQLTLLSFVTLPLLAIGIRNVHRRIQDVGARFYNIQLKLVTVCDDITRAWRVIRTFDAGPFEKRRFETEARALQRISVKSTSAGALLTPVSQTISSIGVAVILAIALYQARTDAKTVGEFVAFITALLLLISRMRALTELSNPVVNGLITARGFFSLMDSPRERDDGTYAPDRVEGRINLSHVTLKYGENTEPALKDFSIAVEPGKTIALVGPSGAGKSSVVNMLLGFIEQDQGDVFLDDVPLSQYTKAALRRQFAVVSQDIILFDGTVAENVIYAAEPSAERVESCLRAASLWEFVQSLPEGLGTRIGANGSRLSGGQRQRLAIARAVYKGAPIWIFDEATSALDTESERAVQQAIENWQGSKTIILIAHRLSTIRNADVIYVMNQGQVVEAGSHQDLMEGQGAYRRMVDVQQQ